MEPRTRKEGHTSLQISHRCNYRVREQIVSIGLDVLNEIIMLLMNIKMKKIDDDERFDHNAEPEVTLY